jgi:hypothetical protein
LTSAWAEHSIDAREAHQQDRKHRCPAAPREGVLIVKSLRRVRTVAAAWTISVLVALLSASVALADGGPTIFPR